MTQASEPDVSVVVPVFNGEAFLEEALASALAQSYPAREIIVVDDGSTDSSSAIAQSLGIRYLFQENVGVSAARNAGLAIAQGEFVAFLDADDAWLPTKLERQVSALRGTPGAGYALCHQLTVFEPGLVPRGPSIRRSGTLAEPAFVPSAWLVRKCTLEQGGVFDEALRAGEDTDWMVRARDAGVGYVMVDEPLLRRRVHKGSLSSCGVATEELFVILRRSLQRKRPREARTSDGT